MNITTHSDTTAVDITAKAMKAKMARQRARGYRGWQTCPVEFLADELMRHTLKGDPIDVANFAMMLHIRRVSADVLAEAAQKFLKGVEYE